MVEFKEGRYVACMWMHAAPGADWLATLYRDGDGPWYCAHRIRVHLDDKAHDSDDQKIGQTVVLNRVATEAEAIAMVDEAARRMVRSGFTQGNKVPIGSADMQTIMGVLSRQPWCHVKSVVHAQA